jgi:hypothetical protein
MQTQKNGKLNIEKTPKMLSMGNVYLDAYLVNRRASQPAHQRAKANQGENGYICSRHT